MFSRSSLAQKILSLIAVKMFRILFNILKEILGSTPVFERNHTATVAVAALLFFLLGHRVLIRLHCIGEDLNHSEIYAINLQI